MKLLTLLNVYAFILPKLVIPLMGFPRLNAVFETRIAQEHWQNVISPRVIYRKLYNLREPPVTAITADNGIRPRANIHNADNKCVIHGKLKVVFLPDPFTFVY